MPSGAPSSLLAIIAGAGDFPWLVAQAAKRQGKTVVVFGVAGWVDAGQAGMADHFEELSVGAIGQLIERLAHYGAREAVMAGKVTKDVLLADRSAFDATASDILQSVQECSVKRVLGAIAERLAQAGVTVLDSSSFLRDAMCPPGPLTARGPTPDEQQDIAYGIKVARALATLDVGQTVIVKRGVIVAVEALEGTDAAIRRAHELAGAGLVVVKCASHGHDPRFDLPIVGPQTLAVARSSGVRCLAVEAWKTLLLNKEALLAEAAAADLCLLGIEPDAAHG